MQVSIFASDLVYHTSKDQIWMLPNDDYSVIFEDATVKMTNRQIIISWYYWEMYRLFPGAPLISTTAVTKFFDSDTHRDLGSILIWHVFNYHESNGEKYTIWDMSDVFYNITNELFNVSCIELSKYVTSVSLHDYIEILEEPSIVEAKRSYMGAAEACNWNEAIVSKEISKVYSTVEKVLYTNKDYLASNDVKKLCMPKIVNKGQIFQLFGIRGKGSDINGTIFHYPINVGYAEGLSTLYDSAIESRSASRSTLMNTDPLKDSEYFKRGIELVASVLLDYVKIPGGCSNYITVKYLVEPEDSVLLKGKYMMVDNVPRVINESNFNSIVGTIINMRTISGCGHEDVQRPCTICLGDSYKTIPPGTNLGFYLSSPLCARISQTIMGTKHHEASAGSKQLLLSKVASKWVRLDSAYPRSLFLTEYACQGKLTIRVDADYVKHISQIQYIDVNELLPERLTRIPSIGISIDKGKGDNDMDTYGVPDVFPLEVSGVGVYLSPSVLSHLKANGWGSGKGYIDIVLKNWDISKPVFGIPVKGDNIMSFFHEVRDFLVPTKNGKLCIVNFKTRDSATAGLISVLKRKINKEFNMVAVEVLIRSMMMINYGEKKYGLPSTSDEFEFRNLLQILSNRSLTSMLAYQDQYKSLLETHWQTNEQTTRHLLDDILHNQ